MNAYFKAPFKESLRRRLAMPLLVLGLLGAGKLTYDETPREQAVQLDLPEGLRANLEGVRLTYMEDDELIFGTEQRFTNGAPASVRTAPTLAPGAYRLEVELAQRGGAVTRMRRTITVPSEGTLHIRCDESP
jgi:hypothetical protein